MAVQEVVGVARVALDPGLSPGGVERQLLGRRGVCAGAAHQEQRTPAGSRGQKETPQRRVPGAHDASVALGLVSLVAGGGVSKASTWSA